MLDLVTLDMFTISGRGQAHVVELPEEFVAVTDPRTLAGQNVLLDGAGTLVRGVEAPAVEWKPGSRAFRRVSLLI